MAWYDYIKGFFHRPPNDDKNEDVDELIELLKSMSDELLFTSESDYPFEVICWELASETIDNESIKHYIQLQNEPTEIKQISPQQLLYPLAKSRPYYSTERREKANRFKQLIQFFESQVSNSTAFKIGKTEIDVYIIGMVSNSHIIGLKTVAVET